MNIESIIENIPQVKTPTFEKDVERIGSSISQKMLKATELALQNSGLSTGEVILSQRATQFLMGLDSDQLNQMPLLKTKTKYQSSFMTKLADKENSVIDGFFKRLFSNKLQDKQLIKELTLEGIEERNYMAKAFTEFAKTLGLNTKKAKFAFLKELKAYQKWLVEDKTVQKGLESVIPVFREVIKQLAKK